LLLEDNIKIDCIEIVRSSHGTGGKILKISEHLGDIGDISMAERTIEQEVLGRANNLLSFHMTWRA
jgi:hypothetical protein